MRYVILATGRIDNFHVVIYAPDNWDEKNLVLFCHGFNSGMDSASYNHIGKEFIKNNIAYAIFSLPYHSERRVDPEDFTVRNCIEDINFVENMIRNLFRKTKISIIGTSFGGYLTLLRLKQLHKPYHKIILKSPAIKMNEIFEKFIPEEEKAPFKSRRYIVLEDEKPMIIKYRFYEELCRNKVFDLDEYDDNILIYHGSDDEVVPVEDSKEFVSKNPHSSLVILAGEGHTYSLNGLTKFSKEVAKLINC
jgi:pimeloyl-ACP methyl ester carboxylesterase